jgi:hypothetical protein
MVTDPISLFSTTGATTFGFQRLTFPAVGLVQNPDKLAIGPTTKGSNPTLRPLRLLGALIYKSSNAAGKRH